MSHVKYALSGKTLRVIKMTFFLFHFLYITFRQVKIFSTEEPYFCSAVFISADFLLAPAMCLKLMQPVDDHPSSHMFVLIEAEHVFYYEGGRRYINKIFYHPKLEEEPVYHNLAVVKLRNPMYVSKIGVFQYT